MVTIALALAVSASTPFHQQQVNDLEKIIELSGRQPELLFRLADLRMEEASGAKKAIALLAELSQEHPDFARADEVLFFLGKALLDTGDERRAVVAFHRLIARHPQSRFVADSHFALGEHLFAHSKGRRDWLTRALASYAGASGPEAIYKQGWCLLNLGDFAGAQEKFRQLVSLAGPRATDAERDFVRAYEKGGGKAAGAQAALETLGVGSRRRALTEMLAKLYRDDGFDGEAALTWQALIREQPRAKEALGFQQQLIESLVRMGKKPLVITQVQRLVTMAAEIEGADVSAAEPLLAGLATGWHSECRKTQEDGCLTAPGALYEAYLALFPKAPRAYELRFYRAELLYAAGDFALAAEGYRSVVDRDVACKTNGGCEAGRFLEAAAWGEIKARDALELASIPQQGSAPAPWFRGQAASMSVRAKSLNRPPRVRL